MIKQIKKLVARNQRKQLAERRKANNRKQLKQIYEGLENRSY